MPTIQHLQEIPALRSLYATTAARTARAAVLRADAPTALPDVQYEVAEVTPDLSQLVAYQHLLGETASDELPAGYVHVLAFPVAVALMAREDFPLPLLGMIHLANRVQQLRPIRVGDRLSISAYAQNLASHRQGTQVELVVEVSTHDELAWRGVSTYLAKGRKLDGLPEAHVRERAEFDAAELPTALWRLRPDLGRAYGRVSGDVNPIHISALSARPFGFPKAIAHGMYTAAKALAVVGPMRTPTYEWQVDFFKPAFLPSTVAFRLLTPLDDGTIGYRGWNLGSGKPHFSGYVKPLR